MKHRDKGGGNGRGFFIPLGGFSFVSKNGLMAGKWFRERATMKNQSGKKKLGKNPNCIQTQMCCV